ncbi:C-type lectin domain family 4 member F isoform X1 [Rousettus aegyptiacus]|uniref:C-type lectin domain family 4 member F n=1 Tax=Rousettus aegyptiacus TaxID=9407 RepID=A0A7J8FEV1_ROUAE|nr:C-type lectin domain family 4 member F isoform X1 [Rousettus aegyptiacus]KAF6446283.1 C-type lectin domain family 4 member F [Rousettus aegyptiacus]
MDGGRAQHSRMKEAKMNDDKVHFCTDNQRVSLYSPGLDSSAVAPIAPKAPRLVLVTLALVFVATVTSLMALCVVVLQRPRPASEAYAFSQGFPGDNTTEELPVEPDNPFHSGRVAELQEAIQMFKDHVENSRTWSVEIHLLTSRVDNVSSQIQMLSGHLKNTSADVQMVKSILKDASTLHFQTQMLRSSLEGTSAEIQKQRGDLEEANALNSKTQSFLKSSLANTSLELHMLSRGLENAYTEIQALKAGLEKASAQAQLANSTLKNANAQILVLRGNLDRVNDLRAQNQVLRNSLKGTNAEVQKLSRSLQNASALNSQTQTLLKGSLDNTSVELQLLRGDLEKAGNEINLLKKDLAMAAAQTQIANSHLEQTDAQIQVLKTELENASPFNSNLQVLNDHSKNVSREIQTLKQGMEGAAALNSKTQTLEDNLQKANAEIQRLKEDFEDTKKILTMKIQEEYSRLENLSASFASQEQLQKTKNQFLQLALQGWMVYRKNLYYFSDIKESWHMAEQFCVSHGAHLASVTSAEEQAYLVMFTSTSYHWIGLTDSGTEGTWRWVDGTPFDFAQSRGFWNRNQPDNWRHKDGQSEDCVHIQQKWNDMNCNSPYQWVCKKPIS